MSNPANELANVLGTALPGKFTDLTADRLAWLRETLANVQAKQLKELDESTEAAVNGLPVLMRGPVRAILGGDKK